MLLLNIQGIWWSKTYGSAVYSSVVSWYDENLRTVFYMYIVVNLLTLLPLRMFKIKGIDISILHCVICSQLLLLCFPDVVSMNAFFNKQINIFCCKHLKCYFLAYIISTFYVYLLPDEQKFHYSDKVWFILKDLTPMCSFFHICVPQIMILKPRLINLYIKVNIMSIRIYNNRFSFQDIRS